jgi:hypothetical protein
MPACQMTPQPDAADEGSWGGVGYAVRFEGRPLSEDEAALVGAVNRVLAARYRSLFTPSTDVKSFSLFRGLPEDHYVSAYLDPSPYQQFGITKDRIADAIELLRLTSLTTYENRRVSAGALLLGSNPQPAIPGAVCYTSELAPLKSFHRLSDGLQTLFLVNPDGKLIDLVNVAQFACAQKDVALPAPSSDAYRAHARATLDGGNICLVLTPNGEIKVWARGVQQFNFIEGRWRLTEAAVRYRQWESAIGDTNLAEMLFRVSLNMAEARHGGMFVVVDRPESARQFVSPGDLLFDGEPSHGRKDQIQYLLRGKRAIDMSSTILETVSRMDGAIVLDSRSNLLAFGAILRHDLTTSPEAEIVEGSRTTAAIEASRFGCVLKISEDGLTSFYRNRERVWEI